MARTGVMENIGVAEHGDKIILLRHVTECYVGGGIAPLGKGQRVEEKKNTKTQTID